MEEEEEVVVAKEKDDRGCSRCKRDRETVRFGRGRREQPVSTIVMPISSRVS